MEPAIETPLRPATIETPLRPATSGCPHVVCHLGSACAFHAAPPLSIARRAAGPRPTGSRPGRQQSFDRPQQFDRPHPARHALTKLENFVHDLIRQEASLESTVRNVKASQVQTAAQGQLITVQAMIQEIQNALVAINTTAAEYRRVLNE